jgi:hypothetical protein
MMVMDRSFRDVRKWDDTKWLLAITVLLSSALAHVAYSADSTAPVSKPVYLGFPFPKTCAATIGSIRSTKKPFPSTASRSSARKKFRTMRFWNVPGRSIIFCTTAQRRSTRW